MITQATRKRNAEILRKKAELLLDEHRDNIRLRADAMLGKSGSDLARMSSAEIEKLLFEFQVNQIELELQNEELKERIRN